MKQEGYTIPELIPRFRELNAIYTAVQQREDISYSEQVLVTSFYNDFRDISSFEKAVISSLLATDENKYNVLIENLHSEIVKNLSFYEVHQDFFNNMDTYATCRKYSSFYDDAIENGLHSTGGYGRKLTELRNALEAAEWKDMKEEANILQKEIDSVLTWYEEERKKLDALYQLQREAAKEAAQYAKNLFMGIHVLGKVMLSVIDSYIPKQEKSRQRLLADATTIDIIDSGKAQGETVYFNMKLIAAIYGQCDGHQFENASETKYYSFFNLHLSETPLQIKPKEKTRVYYLLHKMYEVLPDDTKQSWRVAIFKLLDINKNTYDSKYREPVSDVPSMKSKQFARDIDIIFDQCG